MKVGIWKKVEKDLSDYLKRVASQSKKITYLGSNQAIDGFPSDGFKSDGMLTDDKTLLAIEVEAKQMHPDTNAGKYWLLHSRNRKDRKYRKIILIHVYTPAFDSYKWRKKLAEFYMDQLKSMRVPIKYIKVDYSKEEIDKNNLLLKKFKRKNYNHFYAPLLKEAKEKIQKEIKQQGWAL